MIDKRIRELAQIISVPLIIGPGLIAVYGQPDR
jgi:hypothetical protein